MRIDAITAIFPKRTVTNQDILNMIQEHTHVFGFDGGPYEFEKMKRILMKSLEISGSLTRRWLAKDESSLCLTVKACQEVLDQLGKENKIDCLIVASVYPELVEPATANLIAHAVGLDHVECFDMKEACDGWMKAMKYADSFIKSKLYKRVMVINAEFVMKKGFGIFPELFKFSSRHELEFRFPGFTLGEVAAVTVVSADDTNPWSFTNHTRNDLYDICSIPARHNNPGFVPSERVGKNGAGNFVSYGADLKKYGFPLVIDQFNLTGISCDEINHLFTHSSSYKDWHEVAEQIGLREKIHDIYRTHGNVVSAAIPAAMSVALEAGRLKRGDKVFALVASAGMSFSTAHFTF